MIARRVALASLVCAAVMGIVACQPDATPPTTSILAPAEGSTVAGTVVLAASANDNVGVTKVEYHLWGQPLFYDYPFATATPMACCGWVFSWDTRQFGNGSYAVQSVAYDAAGNQGRSAFLHITISNPTVTVTPAPPFTDGESVSLAGRGFTGSVLVAECVNQPSSRSVIIDDTGCRTIAYPTLDTRGSFSTSVPLFKCGPPCYLAAAGDGTASNSGVWTQLLDFE